jgi:hypothetical protein
VRGIQTNDLCFIKRGPNRLNYLLKTYFFLFLIGIDVQLSGKTDLITLVIIIIREITFLEEINMYRIRNKKYTAEKKERNFTIGQELVDEVIVEFDT